MQQRLKQLLTQPEKVILLGMAVTLFGLLGYRFFLLQQQPTKPVPVANNNCAGPQYMECPDGTFTTRDASCRFIECDPLKFQIKENDDKTRTYLGETYTLDIPPGWYVYPQWVQNQERSNTEYLYGDVAVTVTSPVQSVLMQIVPFTPSYTPPSGEPSKTFDVTIGDTTYTVKEYSITDEDQEGILATFQFEHLDQTYSVSFGTGKPLAAPQDPSIADYETYRETFVEILESIEFVE